MTTSRQQDSPGNSSSPSTQYNDPTTLTSPTAQRLAPPVSVLQTVDNNGIQLENTPTTGTAAITPSVNTSRTPIHSNKKPDLLYRHPTTLQTMGDQGLSSPSTSTSTNDNDSISSFTPPAFTRSTCLALPSESQLSSPTLPLCKGSSTSILPAASSSICSTSLPKQPCSQSTTEMTASSSLDSRPLQDSLVAPPQQPFVALSELIDTPFDNNNTTTTTTTITGSAALLSTRTRPSLSSIRTTELLEPSTVFSTAGTVCCLCVKSAKPKVANCLNHAYSQEPHAQESAQGADHCTLITTKHVQHYQQQHYQRRLSSPLGLLDLPTEILEEIFLRHLAQHRNFIRACRRLYDLSRSPFLRAKYLLLQYGSELVLTRKVVENDRLANSILTPNVVLSLMGMGATFRDRNEFIFRWACSKGHVDLVTQLLEGEPRIDLRLNSDWFLREAAENGREAVVSTLLQQPDYLPSEYGLNKAFEAAYSQSHHGTAKAFLHYAERRGAQLELEPLQQSPGQSSGLMPFTSANPMARRAKRVSAGGLNVQKDEDRALRYAVLGNDIEMVKLLLDYGANVHAFQENAILVAAQKGHVEVLKLLIAAGADFEVLAGAPLRHATEQGHAEVVRVLCQSGADTMWSGCSALRTAALQGHEEIIAILLDHGANVNIHEGTPLQLACQRGHEDAVRVLLQYGANHRLDDGAAFKLALDANHESIMALLIQAETKMRAKEHEVERIWAPQQQQQPLQWPLATVWNSSQSRVLSDSGAGQAWMITAGGNPETLLVRGQKRVYSQISSNPLSVADLFRSGSVCGLVALDDEIRSRQRSESNRL